MSGWSPLRYAAFRNWWLANLTSNVGSWMQTVAAHHLASGPGAAHGHASQTPTTIPIGQ